MATRTKKELQEALDKLKIEYKVRDTIAQLQDLLDNAVILDPNAIKPILEDDITPMVIEGVTNDVVTTPETAVINSKDDKVVFISPIAFNGKKYVFSTQDRNRNDIDTYECNDRESALKKVSEVLDSL